MDRPENNEHGTGSFSGVLISHYLDRGGASSSDLLRWPCYNAVRSGRPLLCREKLESAGREWKKEERDEGEERERQGERERERDGGKKR